MDEVNNWWKTLADNRDNVAEIVGEYAAGELLRFEECFNNHDIDVWYCMQTALDNMPNDLVLNDVFCKLCCEGWILFETLV